MCIDLYKYTDSELYESIFVASYKYSMYVGDTSCTHCINKILDYQHISRDEYYRVINGINYYNYSDFYRGLLLKGVNVDCVVYFMDLLHSIA